MTNFDVEALKDELWTFYLATLITRPQHKPVAVLAFNYLLEMICDTRFARPVTLLLDEFTNYGHIPEIEKKLTMTRNQELGMVLGIQHTGQLKKVYREDAEAILSQPATQIYFRPRDIKTARNISEQLGYTTVCERQQVGRSFRTIERPRKLLDESQVLRLPKSQVIVFMPDSNPLLAETFGPGEHNDFLREPLPERKVHEVSDHVLDLCKPVREEAHKRRPLRYYLTRYLAGKEGARTFMTNPEERTSRFDDNGPKSRFDP